jgi:hypothetical protein
MMSVAAGLVKFRERRWWSVYKKLIFVDIDAKRAIIAVAKGLVIGIKLINVVNFKLHSATATGTFIHTATPQDSPAT